MWLNNSITILGIISGGTPEERKLLMDSGIVDPLNSLLRYPHSSVVLSAVKVFVNIVSMEVELRDHDHVLNQGVIPTFLDLIKSNSDVKDTFWL